MGWFSHQRVEIYHMSTIFNAYYIPEFRSMKTTRFPCHRWPRRFKTMRAQNCSNSDFFEALFMKPEKTTSIKGLRTHQPTENLPQQITVHCLMEATLRTENFSKRLAGSAQVHAVHSAEPVPMITGFGFGVWKEKRFKRVLPSAKWCQNGINTSVCTPGSAQKHPALCGTGANYQPSELVESVLVPQESTLQNG